MIGQTLELRRILETKLLIRRDVINGDADELVFVKPESLKGSEYTVFVNGLEFPDHNSHSTASAAVLSAYGRNRMAGDRNLRPCLRILEAEPQPQPELPLVDAVTSDSGRGRDLAKPSEAPQRIGDRRIEV